MIHLYLFTFSFVTFLGSYDTMNECLASAKAIATDFQYQEQQFSLYCADANESELSAQKGLVY